jgi:hypothetical protein
MLDNRNYKILILIILVCISFFSFAQTKNGQLIQYESTIKNLFQQIIDSDDDSVKVSNNEMIKKHFLKVLNIEGSFKHPFDSLKNIGKLVSPDEEFRIYNWNLHYEDGSFEYFGFIQKYSKEIKSYVVYELFDQSATIENPEDHLGDHRDWFGALYYQIILVKDGRTKYYTLLGWDGNNDYSNKKIIDVLYFTRSDKPKFGKGIFKIDKFKKKRVIFEYSYLASMALRFNDKMNMIVYDHLAPSNPNLKGQYQYYGPDFSYDGLYFKNGKWTEKIDIDVRNPKAKSPGKKNISYTF